LASEPSADTDCITSLFIPSMALQAELGNGLIDGVQGAECFSVQGTMNYI